MTTKFQQRHYEAIAQAIQDEKASYSHMVPESRDHYVNTLLSFEESLASLFARDNPLFDRDRFLRACKVGANVRKRVA